MKKTIAWIILLVLLSCLFIGCGSDRAATSDVSTSETLADEKLESEEVTSVKKENESTNADGNSLNAVEIKPSNALYSMSVGDVADCSKNFELKEISEEEAQEIDRSMRDFKTPQKTPMINNAKSYYYYNKLNDFERHVYEATTLAVYYSYESVCTTSFLTKENPSTTDFRNHILKIIYCIHYDHPEFFWNYNSDETYFTWSYTTNRDSNNNYTVYVSLNESYKKYVDEINKFNDAVDDFLEDINTSDSQWSIARSVHDKLLNDVTYDYDVCDNDKSNDRAHTAYGALVSNSAGRPHYAVCDGYTQAYIYLLQQAGMEAVFLCGMAGAGENMGLHAWTIVKIDGNWYEVDVTWDDFGSAAEHYSSSDQPFYGYAQEALADTYYREKIEHRMFAISTNNIRYFNTSDEYRYWSRDGQYWVNLVGDSEHIRVSDVYDYEYDFDKQVISMAPIAISDFSSSDYTITEGPKKNPFYGVWCYSSKDMYVAQSKADELSRRGLDGRVYISDEWSNLSQERWYCVSAGEYSTEADAEKVLDAAMDAGFSHAYIKYTGEYIG